MQAIKLLNPISIQTASSFYISVSEISKSQSCYSVQENVEKENKEFYDLKCKNFFVITKLCWSKNDEMLFFW